MGLRRQSPRPFVSAGRGTIRLGVAPLLLGGRKRRGQARKVEGSGAGKEPIGQRIVEVPDHPDLTTLRDWRSNFTTYVPPGSIKKGEALVMTGGNGKTVQCTYCHGADLLGIGPVPPIAGRSAIYTFRQLYDFKDGTRHGAWSGMMKPVVDKLTLDDMIAIVAYTSSRPPSAGAKAAPQTASK